MWKRALTATVAGARQNPSTRLLSSASNPKPGKPGKPSPASAYAAVNSLILRSLKDHYLEVSKMTPPPKINPPSPFTVIKGALDSGGPVLKRSYGDEEISISVSRLATILPEDAEDDDGDDSNDINQLFLHVDVSKPGQSDSLLFLCGLYPDALGIHSVSMRQKTESGYLPDPNKYNGPVFEEIEEKVRDAFHDYIDDRGINEGLFSFLKAWLYVKDHRNLMRWYKTLGSFVSGPKEVAAPDVKQGSSRG